MMRTFSTADLILTRLRHGPALSSELAAIVGEARQDCDGRLDLGGAEASYDRQIVEVTIRRLNERGYIIDNMRSVGGRSVAMYRLVAEPSTVRVCHAAGCGTILRSGNRAAYCSAHSRQSHIDEVLDAIIAGLEADLAGVTG